MLMTMTMTVNDNESTLFRHIYPTNQYIMCNTVKRKVNAKETILSNDVSISNKIELK